MTHNGKNCKYKPENCLILPPQYSPWASEERSLFQSLFTHFHHQANQVLKNQKLIRFKIPS